jgi:cellulose synthase/poly-beta-1,6-N-acetylglucosamine synthase-like glycosyltransferase
MYLILGYFLFRVFQQLFGFFATYKFLKGKGKNNCSIDRKNSQTSKTILIIIPIFKEKFALLKAIDFWKSTQFSPIFISTEREGNFESCESCKIVRENSAFEIIHSPNQNGFKATQLNFAIQTLLKERDFDYISIFDIDSKPDLRVFEHVSRYENSQILQMPTLFFEEFENNSFYGKGSAIYQSRRVLAYEIPSLLKGDFSYLVGHGLFIRKDILKKIGFNEETLTEDLIFGYSAHLKDFDIKPLPFFDTSSTPKSIWETTKQASRWFIGDLTFVKYVDFSFRDFLKIFKRYLHIFDWLFGSIAVLTLIFFGEREIYPALILALSIFAILHIFTIKIAGEKLKLEYIFSFALRGLLNSLAPIYGVYRYFLSILGVEKLEFNKTEKC